jgi:hypothetical protein
MHAFRAYTIKRTIVVAAFSGQNIAIPSSTILNLKDGKLDCDTASYRHLKAYLRKIEILPDSFGPNLEELHKALDDLQTETQRFGSPKALRQMIATHPQTLAHQLPPDMLYGSIIWLLQQLHLSSVFVSATLQTLALEARSSHDVKDSLLLLGRSADAARMPIAALIDSLRDFKSAIKLANDKLSEVYLADTATLHTKQENLGALKVSIENRKKAISELGFFSSAQKRKQLEQELDALQQQLKILSMQTEQLRIVIKELESILESEPWLPMGVDDIVSFLEKLRQVWTTFGTDLTQMAADALEAQLADLAWVKQCLGLGKAIEQWTLISQVAKQFVVESLVDVSVN